MMTEMCRVMKNTWHKKTRTKPSDIAVAINKVANHYQQLKLPRQFNSIAHTSKMYFKIVTQMPAYKVTAERQKVTSL